MEEQDEDVQAFFDESDYIADNGLMLHCKKKGRIKNVHGFRD